MRSGLEVRVLEGCSGRLPNHLDHLSRRPRRLPQDEGWKPWSDIQDDGPVFKTGAQVSPFTAWAFTCEGERPKRLRKQRLK